MTTVAILVATLTFANAVMTLITLKLYTEFVKQLNLKPERKP